MIIGIITYSKSRCQRNRGFFSKEKRGFSKPRFLFLIKDDFASASARRLLGYDDFLFDFRLQLFDVRNDADQSVAFRQVLQRSNSEL